MNLLLEGCIIQRQILAVDSRPQFLLEPFEVIRVVEKRLFVLVPNPKLVLLAMPKNPAQFVIILFKKIHKLFPYDGQHQRGPNFIKESHIIFSIVTMNFSRKITLKKKKKKKRNYSLI